MKGCPDRDAFFLHFLQKLFLAICFEYPFTDINFRTSNKNKMKKILLVIAERNGTTAENYFMKSEIREVLNMINDGWIITKMREIEVTKAWYNTTFGR